MTCSLNAIIQHIDAELNPAVDRLFDLLRIPSISTDSAYDAETHRAAQWLCDDLKTIGFDISVRETTGHPMVVGHYQPPDAPDANDDMPHVLYYGHYDVQPADPLELWDTGPFEPVLVDGAHGKHIVARGAVDDKGQVMTFIEAFRAWMNVHGSMPIKVSVILEGEEESGSPSLDPFLEANKKELTADVCVVCDTGMWNIDTPAITYMLRGLVYVEITLHGPSHDLHSGMYGGTLVNPANALCRILGELHDENRVVQIPGFYDDVLPLGEAEKAQWNGLGFDEESYMNSAGMKTAYGEAGYSTIERNWSRPTCDINGIWGGYTGEGAKTVIGAHCTAKVSCRLVPEQDPQKVYDGLVKFLNERTPPDCHWEVQSHGINPAIRVPTDSPFLQAAMNGLESTYNKAPVLMGCGGSIPAVGSIQNILGMDSLLIGFGLEDDRVHSPNEKFEMKCFQMGIRSHTAIMAQFASMSATTTIPARDTIRS